MNKILAIFIIICMLCVSMSWTAYAENTKIVKEETTYVYSENGQHTPDLVATDSDNTKEIVPVIGYGDEFGIWIHTKYNDVDDSTKLDIDLTTFKLMLDGGGWKQYKLTMQNHEDTIVQLQFSRTQIYALDEYVDVVQTRFVIETSCDTIEDYEVTLEVRFPFSLLKSKSKSHNLFLDGIGGERVNKFFDFINRLTEKSNGRFMKIFFEKFIRLFQKNSDSNIVPMPLNAESYFCARIGFSSLDGDEGPRKVETRLFFGRNSIFDPRVFRMKITPSDLGRKFNLGYFNSYLTVDESSSEAFYRTFSVDFEPAAELQTTSILREGKISYDFGSSAGTETKISFRALGGALSDIIQSFVIDPLPDYMSFDLTILGERSFKYRSDRSYSVAYLMDSEQEGNLVKLELNDLPEQIDASWGLSINLGAKTASGFVNLDMDKDIGEVALSLYGSDKPFLTLAHFPRSLHLSGFIDIPNLRGDISAFMENDATTTLTIPISYDKWEITGNLKLNGGYGKVSFDLPSGGSNHISVGLDTNNGALFGIELSVVDTTTDVEVLTVSVQGIATDDLRLSFNNEGGQITDFAFNGMITKLIDLIVNVNFQGLNFDISGTWDLGDSSSLLIEVNQPVELNFDNFEAAGFVFDGSISLNPGSYLEMEWVRGDEGHFIIQSHNVEAAADLTFGEKYSSNFYFYVNVVLAPHCVVNFDWEWGQIGHVMVFTNLFEKLDFEVLYNYNPGEGGYQYGLEAHATDVGFTRTLQWDLVNGFRFWWLGDEPLPNNWDVHLLWNYEWYDVL